MLLKQDPFNSHAYLLKFFRKAYTLDKIADFKDKGLQNFINGVVSFTQLGADITLKQFV